MGGGSLHSGSYVQAVCGSSFESVRPTVSPILVTLSRISDPDVMGLQVAHACSEEDTIDVHSVAGDQGILIAQRVRPGAVAPRPPNLDHASASHTDSLSTSVIQVFVRGSSAVAHEQSWSSALAAGGLATLSDGHNYALLVMGSSLSATAGGWHNPLTVTVVDASP
jgi:hypothetical protein